MVVRTLERKSRGLLKLFRVPARPNAETGNGEGTRIGAFSGRSEREVAQEAADWWGKILDEIDEKARVEDGE